jgi:hypothetical protein
MGVLSKLKDSAVALAIRVAFNHRYKRYGTMAKLTLDLTDRRVEGDILLKGEPAPIHFAAEFELADTPAGPTVTVHNPVLSREWMQLLARDLVAGRPLPLPPDAAVWLKRLGAL